MRPRHPLIVLTAAGVILATLVATLATTTPTTPGWHTLPSVTWPEITAAVLLTATIGALIVVLRPGTKRAGAGQ